MYPGHWAKIHPEKVAIVNTLTGAEQTYAQLNDRSNQLAQLLWDKGLRRGDHIALFMENDIRYFEVVWAALRSGLYITTINRYLTCEEAGYIVDDCEAQALITSAVMHEAEGLQAHAPNCHTWLSMDDLDARESSMIGPQAPDRLILLDDLSLEQSVVLQEMDDQGAPIAAKLRSS